MNNWMILIRTSCRGVVLDRDVFSRETNASCRTFLAIFLLLPPSSRWLYIELFAIEFHLFFAECLSGFRDVLDWNWKSLTPSSRSTYSFNSDESFAKARKNKKYKVSNIIWLNGKSWKNPRGRRCIEFISHDTHACERLLKQLAHNATSMAVIKVHTHTQPHTTKAF